MSGMNRGNDEPLLNKMANVAPFCISSSASNGSRV